MNHVRLVCFDLGGVIIRHHRSWEQACRALGLPYDDAVAHPDLVRERRALTALHHTGKIATDEFFAALARATGNRYSPAQVRQLHDAWIFAEYDCIGDVLQRLVAGARADTGILSNTNEVHWNRLGHGARDGLPLFPSALQLNHRHASHLLGLAKPDPAIYRAFETHTGYRGEDILFFDDLPENIHAAASLGWRTHLIDHTGDTAAQVEGALHTYGLIDRYDPSSRMSSSAVTGA
ncbi:MAG: haloacid dehalogenase [Phycisphaerae bacterium]|nr:MAG: haloacid dehalogenase [Phycisphaerae bacterium]